MKMVAQAGVEPAHPYEYTILNRARLPIPPLSHMNKLKVGEERITGGRVQAS
jgi:hypothetical protein